MMDYLSMGSH